MVQLTNNEFVTVPTENVYFSFFHFPFNDSSTQADIVLISTSEPNGLCYIETAELDGETNLKIRQALEETCQLADDIEQLSNFDGKIKCCHRNSAVFFVSIDLAELECEAPNNNLARFEGNLIWKNKTYSLKNENLLLRGTRLRNTQWAFGSKRKNVFEVKKEDCSRVLNIYSAW